MKVEKVETNKGRCGECHVGDLIFIDWYDRDSKMFSMKDITISEGFYQRILQRLIYCIVCGIRGFDTYWRDCPKCKHQNLELKFMRSSNYRIQTLCRCGSYTLTTFCGKCVCDYNEIKEVERGEFLDKLKKAMGYGFPIKNIKQVKK